MLLSAGFADALPRDASRWLNDHWGLEEGLPQNEVLAITQDRRGFLWAATHAGLVRFDGLHLEVYDPRRVPAMRHPSLTMLADAADGGLWIASRDGLLRMRDERFSAVPEAAALPDTDFQTMLVEDDGTIWLGTRSGLARLRDGVSTWWSSADEFQGGAVLALGRSAEALWIGTSKGLNRLVDDRLTSWREVDGVPLGPIRAITLDRWGHLWLGGGLGVMRWTEGRLVRADAFRESDVYAIAGPQVAVWSLFVDREGDLWVGADNGIWRRTTEGWIHHHTTQRLDQRALAFHEDRDGNLWVGMHNLGLIRLRERPVTALTVEEGLPHEITWSTLDDRDGNLWIGNQAGLSRLAPNGDLRTWTSQDGLPPGAVIALHQDLEGALWIGTTEGLAHLAPRSERPRIVFTGQGSEHSRVNCFAADPDGDDPALWIGTQDAGIRRFLDGRWENPAQDGDLPHDLIHALAFDRDGALWIGTDGGLVRYSDGRFKTFTPADGLAGRQVWSLLADPDGGLWIGHAGRGLSLYRDGVFVSYSTAEGLFDDFVLRILDDGIGRLWISGLRGVFFVHREELLELARGERTSVTSVAFDERDGMPSRECAGGVQPAGTRLRDGRLVFPTLEGLAIFDPTRLPIHRTAPHPWIEEILVDNAPRSREEAADLEPGTKSLVVRYTAPDLVAPHALSFRIRLDGFDDGWNLVGNRRSAFYTNLAPGEYHFHVEARGRGGEWTSGETQRFRVRPALHQTAVFYLVCIGLLGTLLLAAHRWRVGRLVRYTHELERMRSELEGKNAEMERLLHTVSQLPTSARKDRRPPSDRS